MATKQIIIFFTAALKVSFLYQFLQQVCSFALINRKIIFYCLETAIVGINMLIGKCYISCEADLNLSVREYTAQGPDRFYFREVYYKQYFLCLSYF